MSASVGKKPPIPVLTFMDLSMSPAKMVVAKVVSHKDMERQVILALEAFKEFEFIDVPRQAGIAEIERSRDEEAVYSVIDRIIKMIESLDLDTKRRRGPFIETNDHNLSDSLAFVADVLDSVEEEIIEIDRDLTTATQEHSRQLGIRDVALSLRPLGIDPSLLGSTDYTFTTAGIMPTGRVSQLEWSLNELTEGVFSFNSISVERGMSVACISVSIERKDAAERILSAMEFETFVIPEESSGLPEEVSNEATERISELEIEIERLEMRKEHLSTEWGGRILAAWELLMVEKSRVDIKRYIVYTPQSLKAWGWIPHGTEEQFQALLIEMTNSVVEVTFDEPDFAEVESPTYLKNPSFMKPTQDVVEAFGTPGKHDMDPTKIMWLSFPLIFGIVFADVGQGFLILLIGLFAWRAKRRGDDWGDIMGYIQSGAEGLVMMGIFAIIGGFLFGSFFGSETVIEPMWPAFAHYIDGHANPYRASHMLKLSIEIGAIQLTLGILLNLYVRLKHKEYREALAAFAYAWLYLGFVNLLFGVSYNSIGEWFSDKAVNLWIPIVGIGAGTGDNGVYPTLPINAFMFTILVFIVPFILMALPSLMGGMDGMVHLLENGLGMISHTVSYARIFALNTVHIILSGVFFTLIPPLLEIPFPAINLFGLELIPEHVIRPDTHAEVGAYLPLLGAIIGTFIVGILEGLLAFMHTLRLHFVEWFSKFYHAGGTPFIPFGYHRKHTVSMYKPQQMVMATT
jgi:V/A-type H+-transporting ATPase subunit I